MFWVIPTLDQQCCALCAVSKGCRLHAAWGSLEPRGSVRHRPDICRVRKQHELEELSQRMRHLEQDNASLRSHVDSRNAEIARLRESVDGLDRSHGSLPHAVPPAHDSPSLGPDRAGQVRKCPYTKGCRSMPMLLDFLDASRMAMLGGPALQAS